MNKPALESRALFHAIAVTNGWLRTKNGTNTTPGRTEGAALAFESLRRHVRDGHPLTLDDTGREHLKAELSRLVQMVPAGKLSEVTRFLNDLLVDEFGEEDGAAVNLVAVVAMTRKAVGL